MSADNLEAGMKTQIPIQQKIAELERRIEQLETKLRGIGGPVRNRGAWTRMWEAFDEVFR